MNELCLEINGLELRGNNEGSVYIVEQRIHGPYTVAYWGEYGLVTSESNASDSLSFLFKVGDELFHGDVNIEEMEEGA